MNYKLRVGSPCIIARYFAFLVPLIFIPHASALELSPITYKEALSAYRATGGLENYRCALLPADKFYAPLENAEPIAVELDDQLFIKLDGNPMQIGMASADEMSSVYSSKDLTVTLIKQWQSDFSEYHESDNRQVDIAVKAASEEKTYKAFGEACGI
ncbi:hypothetical protein WG219_20890 [Ectopseudomonas mendocina]|uniref:Uncharacterized protein n=1 Tax=Ectopseudomonas mendocina TaxID=300 RepID=A0ABZ2RI63_ECTME